VAFVSRLLRDSKASALSEEVKWGKVQDVRKLLSLPASN
jgi:hypothetical protein